MTSTTQKKIILKRCGSCSDFASLTLAFALQLRKSTEKPQSVPLRHNISPFRWKC